MTIDKTFTPGPESISEAKPIVMPLYTVQQCREDGTLYGSVHGSEDCGKTTCGIPIDEKWRILSNDSSRPTTCKACAMTAMFRRLRINRLRHN